jgi:hypothetical protein
MGNKKDEQKLNGNGRVKFRYADSERFFDLDVDNIKNETGVVDGLKSIANALAGRSLPVQRVLPAAPKRPTQQVVVEDETPELEDVVEETEDDGQEEPTESGSNGAGPKRTYNYNPPKFLDNLDLTKASEPVAEFVAEKGDPTETNDRYIVVATWLNQQMSVEEFGINEIYTVFKNLGWQSSIPVNHSQPLRDLKTKRHFLTKEKGHGYKVNWAGLQYVGKMGATT